MTRRRAIVVGLGVLAGFAKRGVAAMKGLQILRRSEQAGSAGAADYFTGTVRVEPLVAVEEPSRLSAARVTFEAGARTVWHTHPLGQTLLVTAGTGWVQEWGSEKEEMREGDVVRIPPGVKHWHGAGAEGRMTHVALQEQKDGAVVAWMEAVSEGQYRGR